MSNGTIIALRFQRAELDQKAGLSELARIMLGSAPGPEQLLAELRSAGLVLDAANALAMMLPHRQSVWWACLAARLLPDLAMRDADRAAVEAAEAWVQSLAPSDAEAAGEAAEACSLDGPAGWVAMAAHWSGTSIAPRGQQPVPPAAHLPGVAVRAVMQLLVLDRRLAGRIGIADLLQIGLALMAGDIGREAQAALRTQLNEG